MSDQQFHNVGLTPEVVQQAFIDANDQGAATGLAAAIADPLNTLGVFSDGSDGRLPEAVTPAMTGAFRTPTLRCVSMRPTFMHTGQIGTLAEVVAFFNGGGGSSGYPGTSEIHALGPHAAPAERPRRLSRSARRSGRRSHVPARAVARGFADHDPDHRARLSLFSGDGQPRRCRARPALRLLELGRRSAFRLPTPARRSTPSENQDALSALDGGSPMTGDSSAAGPGDASNGGDSGSHPVRSLLRGRRRPPEQAHRDVDERDGQPRGPGIRVRQPVEPLVEAGRRPAHRGRRAAGALGEQERRRELGTPRHGGGLGDHHQPDLGDPLRPRSPADVLGIGHLQRGRGVQDDRRRGDAPRAGQRHAQRLGERRLHRSPAADAPRRARTSNRGTCSCRPTGAPAGPTSGRSCLPARASRARRSSSTRRRSCSARTRTATPARASESSAASTPARPGGSVLDGRWRGIRS